MRHSTFDAIPSKIPMRQRIESKVSIVPITGCWMWMGHIDRGFYGKIAIRLPGWENAYPIAAHRASYEAFVGRIPSDMDLDHLCRNRWCVNPSHLEPVTKEENRRRVPALTRCRRGHEFTPENTVRQGRHGKWRLCKACCHARGRMAGTGTPRPHCRGAI